MSSEVREALNQLLGLIDNEILVFNDGLDTSEVSNAQYQIDKAGEAYDKPVLNCEVGTAKEQVERHKKWCNGNICLFTHSCRICFANWSQKPYNEEVK